MLKYFSASCQNISSLMSGGFISECSPIFLLGPHRADTGAGMSIRKLAGFSMGEPSACPMPPRQAKRYRGNVRNAGMGRIWECAPHSVAMESPSVAVS